MARYMNDIWKANAKATNVEFRMNLSMNEYIREIHKEFLLLANYPKEKGEVFKI